MSVLTYIASDAPLKELENPHNNRLLSVNEALELGMEIPEFMLEADFDKNKPNVHLWYDVSIVIDPVNYIIDDGGHDDDLAILPLEKSADIFTQKPYCVCLEWQFTKGRANRLIEYLREHLEHTTELEIWHIWMMNHDNDDYPPKIRNSKTSIDGLTADDIEKIEATEPWREPITHYCFTISATPK